MTRDYHRSGNFQMVRDFLTYCLAVREYLTSRDYHDSRDYVTARDCLTLRDYPMACDYLTSRNFQTVHDYLRDVTHVMTVSHYVSLTLRDYQTAVTGARDYLSVPNCQTSRDYHKALDYLMERDCFDHKTQADLFDQ